MKNAVVQIHFDEGYRTGLVVSEGPKFFGVIWPDSAGMKIRKIRKDAKMNVISGYSLPKAKRRLRKCGKLFGITKSAKKALKA